MKRITSLSLMIVALQATSGCISRHLVKNKAQPHLEYSMDERREVDGQPGYYALLPLTVVGDVATSPFQIVYFLFTDDSHFGSASIHGFPIPLP
jgi:hypothetical protein